MSQESQENKDPDQEELTDPGQEPHPGIQAVQALRKLPQTERLKVIEQVGIAVVHSFSGPLPSPEAFEKYNRIQPDAADRILSMAEKEQQIRSDEIKGAQANDKLKISGSIITSLALASVSGLSAWLGHTNTAIALGLSGVIAAIVQLATVWLVKQDNGAE